MAPADGPGGADAAAESAILSIFGATNTGTNAFGTATFTCTNGTDVRTPCAYARLNSFSITGSSDVISVDFPTSVTGVTLSTEFTPAAVHVLISRPGDEYVDTAAGRGRHHYDQKLPQPQPCYEASTIRYPS